MSETIAAIATHLGEGGIGVIRISGDQALRIAQKLFHLQGDLFPDPPTARHVYFGEIRDPGTDLCIDQVLLTWFKSPQSYTGEDVVEISGHGGVFVVSKILQLTLDAGARLAEPGEFTRRAFLNRRMDLAQAEAVADVISADSEVALRTAVAHLKGQLSIRLNAFYDSLLVVLAQLEAAMDFPEEGLKLHDAKDNLQAVRKTQRDLEELIASYRQGKIYREGARVAMVGKPNVGKSSILNALLGEDRAIVTPHAGTTRDLLEERLRIEDIHINIIDSAGLRHDPEHIEEIGIARTRAALARADLALVIFDNSKPFGKDDDLLVQEVEGKSCLIVINKNDLPARLEIGILQTRLPGSEIIHISAATLAGMSDLLAAIRKFVLQGKMSEESVVITRERQRELLCRANNALEKACVSLEQNLPEELIAVDINMALDSLGNIIGKTFEDDLLDHIFSNFCIGK